MPTLRCGALLLVAIAVLPDALACSRQLTLLPQGPLIPGPIRLPPCTPPTDKEITAVRLIYTRAGGGGFAVGLPEGWRRYDDDANSVGVAAYGSPGESIHVRFHPSDSPREAAERYLGSKTVLSRTPVPIAPVLPPSANRRAAARWPTEITVHREFLDVHSGPIRSVARIAVAPAAGGFISIEESHPPEGSCSPGVFEAVKKSLRGWK